MGPRRVAAVFVLLLAFPVAAQKFEFRPGYERVLIPVFAGVPASGAAGSSWVTEITGFNHGSTMARVSVDYDSFCGIPEGCGPFDARPHSSFRVPTSFVEEERRGRTAGVFVFVSDVFSRVPYPIDVISLNARVRDVSRATHNAGTEIPVVRAADTFTGGTIALTNIAFREGFRTRLRVYDFDGANKAVVRVRVMNDPEWGAYSRVLSEHYLTVAGDVIVRHDVPLPGYAELPIDGITLPQHARAITILIDLPAQGRFWAMASTTNNETQLVTITSPGR